MSIKNPINVLLSSLALLLCLPTAAQEPYPFTSEAIAEFNEPWAIEFLPDGRMLVTEKPGDVWLVTQDGDKTDVSGVPEVDYFFQGGLGDVVLHPDFDSNQQIYLSYVEAGDDETRGAVVARGTLNLDTPAIENMEIIWRATPKVEGGLHFSYRMLFDDEGHLFVSSGDRNHNWDTPDESPGQDVNQTMGKTLRLNDDGTPAAGNPFVDQGSPADEVWSMGHRNPLGLALDPEGRLWDAEMGPRGGDELNLVEPGSNYGYPYVSNGNDYRGTIIPNHDTDERFVKPKVWWNPVISPSSLMFYTGDKFPDWEGNAFIGGLSSMSLIRIQVNDENAVEAQRFLMGKRIRGVEQGPDGYIWLLEDGAGGRLLKVIPR